MLSLWVLLNSHQAASTNASCSHLLSPSVYPALGWGLEDVDPKKEQDSCLARTPTQGPGGLLYGLATQTPLDLSPRARSPTLLSRFFEVSSWMTLLQSSSEA